MEMTQETSATTKESYEEVESALKPPPGSEETIVNSNEKLSQNDTSTLMEMSQEPSATTKDSSEEVESALK